MVNEDILMLRAWCFPLLLLILLLGSVNAATADRAWTIYVENALPRGLPAVLHLTVADGAVRAAMMTSPYFDPVGRQRAEGSSTSFVQAVPELSAVRCTATSIEATVAVAFGSVSGRFRVQAGCEDNAVRGTWQGTWGEAERSGGLDGLVGPSTAIPDGAPLALLIENPQGAKWNGRVDLLLTCIHRGGVPTDGVISATATGSAYNTAKFPAPIRMAVASDGRRVPFLASTPDPALRDLKGGIAGDRIDLTATVGDIPVTITATAFGSSIVGTATRADGTACGVVGHVGMRDPPALPLPDLSAQPTPADHLLAAALWTYTAPEIGGLWRSDAIAASFTKTTDKQYDNGFQNTYGGAASMAVLARIAPDPALRQHARLAAKRAGWAMLQIGLLRENLTHYYKGMFWLAVWGPLGCLELHALTGETVWLERAKAFGATLAKLQMPQGTWTWFDEESGESGKSNERNNRTFDNRPLHCGEHLLFLGRLRAAGVQDFVDVERKARAWMQAEFVRDPRALSMDRRPGEALEAMAATMYGLYLVDHAEGDAIAEIRQVIAFIERELMADGQRVSGFSPAVQDYHPRWGLGDSAGPSTAATLRLAVIHRTLAERHGQAEDRRRAEALTAAVLARQQAESGMIHHIGLNDLPLDHGKRIHEHGDQHQCSFLRAETLVLLHRLLAPPVRP